MRKKIPFTRGTLGLALAGSLFLGCQDFLGGDDGKRTAAPPTDESVEHAAQAVAAQDSAKDMPAEPVVIEPVQPVEPEPAKPVEPEPAKPAPEPASTGLTPEQQVCVDLYNELQTAKDPRYGEVKNLYGSGNCDAVLGDKKPAPPPYVPLTTAEQCKMYRYNVINTPSTGDPKYEAYMAQMAITCADYP